VRLGRGRGPGGTHPGRPWRLANVPVPPAHVVGLVAAVVLQRVSPRPPVRKRWLLALPLTAAGTALATASVRAAGEVHLAQPDQLVTTGPYAVIRHPMYVAWGLIHLGLGLATGSRWTLLTAPLAAVVVHGETTAEERRLLVLFPAQMGRYRTTTPAYVPRSRATGC
jgi:protein-S-isoprenylcysteine O-methyltransferase Ste14